MQAISSRLLPRWTLLLFSTTGSADPCSWELRLLGPLHLSLRCSPSGWLLGTLAPGLFLDFPALLLHFSLEVIVRISMALRAVRAHTCWIYPQLCLFPTLQTVSPTAS